LERKVVKNLVRVWGERERLVGQKRQTKLLKDNVEFQKKAWEGFEEGVRGLERTLGVGFGLGGWKREREEKMRSAEWHEIKSNHGAADGYVLLETIRPSDDPGFMSRTSLGFGMGWGVMLFNAGLLRDCVW
jgi:hypothetical protein